MAPIKLEDTIREKMQERELQPSPDTWNRLEARLGEEKKSGLDRSAWFAIAASFIGILILASVYLNSNSITTNNNIVEENTSVEEPRLNNDLPIKNIITTLDNTDVELVLEESKPEEIKVQEKVPKPNEVIARSIPAIDKSSTMESEVVVANEIPKESEILESKQDPIILNNEDFIKSKINEVVAEVEKRANTENAVSAEEIDALLQSAQREIGNKRILNSQTRKVDAAALLTDVEFELERSFRDKVFDALGDGYKIIRTAVVERNN